MRLKLTVMLAMVSMACTWSAASGPPMAAAPTVTGPIPATAAAGHPSRNYPFFSTAQWLDPYGYVEEEFTIEGLAVEYIGPPGQTATIAPGGPYAYKTRAIVRRPKSARKFNGTVILEWTNVGAGFGIDNDWYLSHEHLMRRGFVHIGVIVEPNGIDSPTLGLKQWSPVRYGSLDVAAGGRFTAVTTLRGPLANELSYSIFSQVAHAAKNPSGVALLGNLKVRNVVATGHSRSAGRLFIYYDRVHLLEKVVDGFVFHGGVGDAITVRTDDVQTPSWKFMAETDVIRSQAAARQPDSRYFRNWEVSGSSHQDWDLGELVGALAARDLPPPPAAPPCERPGRSRVPPRLVLDAVYDWMKLWIERGSPPPHAPPIAMTSVGPAGSGPNVPPASTAARDEHGNALGGIRLAQFAVATATSTGLNAGPGNCWLGGSHEPFDAAKLARLYPNRSKYLAEVRRITDENLKAGYITKEGAEQTRKDASRLKLANW